MSEVYEWIFIAEEHAKRVAGAVSICRDWAAGCVFVPKLISVLECYEDVCMSEKLEHDAVLVAAFYPLERVNEDFMVRVGNSAMIQLVVPKVRGADWIPLVTRNQYVYVAAGDRVRIEPKPEVILVLEIQPSGRVIVQISGERTT